MSTDSQKWCFPKNKTVINAKAVKYSLPVCLILTQPNDLNVKSIAILNKWKQQIKNN